VPENFSTPINAEDLIKLIRELAARLAPRRLKIMEVCGTHTVAAQSAGIRSVLPENVKLISGPGCPVCVTPAGYIDQAAQLAADRGARVVTYGDMVRVPGISTTLEEARRRGGDVSVVYSVTEALQMARREAKRHVVFLGVGFETTAPGTAFAVKAAHDEGLKNFKVLMAHKRIIPAMDALLADPNLAIDGFIAPGHVSVIIGYEAYAPIVSRWGRPCVVTGFTGEQMLLSIVRILTQLVSGHSKVESVYTSRVLPEGNVKAQRFLDEVFVPGPSNWRGMGNIPESGMDLREEYADCDAKGFFKLEEPPDREPPGCRCADVIRGMVDPPECPLFGKRCTPITPVGACMVSREGSCSAFYRFRSVEKWSG